MPMAVCDGRAGSLASMSDALQGFSGVSDEEFDRQVQALLELPLDQRIAGLAAAETALRQRLGRSETAADGPPDPTS